MSVLGNGLELTYKRSARRRGGVEAALGALSLVDISSGTVFSDIISPGTVRSSESNFVLIVLIRACQG